MEPLVLNGWKIYFDQCFLDQILTLSTDVAAIKAKHPADYHKKAATKLLVAIKVVIKERIAADPLGPQFRQGGTLGDEHKNWFRAKFMQQFRLFFRCSEKQKAIVIAWVNGFDPLRACDSRTDAYKVFARMLAAGKPPGDWDELFKQAQIATEKNDPDTLSDFL